MSIDWKKIEEGLPKECDDVLVRYSDLAGNIREDVIFFGINKGKRWFQHFSVKKQWFVKAIVNTLVCELLDETNNYTAIYGHNGTEKIIEWAYINQPKEKDDK